MNDLYCGVQIPGYQQAFVNAENGASGTYRNFPDVSMPADRVWEHWRTDFVGVGTSAAAPLWAGYAALVNQYAASHGEHRLGFVNPTLYGIAAKDSFHDIADGVSNSLGLPDGYYSVRGYDLATGLGSPTCTLLQQLGTSHPTTPQTYTTLLVHIVSGRDGADDDSTAFLGLIANDPEGSEIANYEIKIAHESGWQQGSVHDLIYPLPYPLSPNDIGQVKLHFNPNRDDWDIAGFHVMLAYGTGYPDGCVLDLSGNNMDGLEGNTCDIQQPECSLSGVLTDGTAGVMRLNDDHRDAVFDVSSNFGDLTFTGCPAWGGAVSVPTYDTLEFIIDTGDDDFDSDAQLKMEIFDSIGSRQDVGILHSEGELVFDDQTEWRVMYTMQNGPLALADIAKITLTMTSRSTFDEAWHNDAIDIYGLSSTSPWVRTCVYKSTQGFGLDRDDYPTHDLIPTACE